MFSNLSPFNMLMYMLMISSSLMAISSNNWLMTWSALEMNMLSFIPMMMNSNKYQESEAMLKYFLAQALGSSILLMSSSIMWMNLLLTTNIPIMMLIISLLLKLGMVPCHMWFPSVMTSLSWISCLILSTWQKLAPLSIMMFSINMFTTPMFLLLVPSINAIIGAMMGMNQTKLKSIMAFSSITHMGWMSSFMLPNKPIFSILYLMIYSLIITPLFWTLYMNMSMTNQFKFNNPTKSTTHLSIILLSLSGIPPMMGFFPKWMTLSNLLMFPSTIITLLCGAMMNMFFYLNILFSALMSSNQSMKSLTSMPHTTLFTMSTMTLPIIICSMLYAMTMFN